MGRTRTQLRQLTAQQFPLPLITGTAEAASDTNTIVDDILTRWPNDHFIGADLYLTSGTYSGSALRGTDSSQSAGSIDFVPTLAGQADDATFEILPYPASAIHQALEEAMLEAYLQGWLVRELWLNHWLTGSPIYNSTFDYWDAAATIDGWTVTTSTISKVLATATYMLPGMQVVSFGGSAGNLALDALYERYLYDLSGYSITLRAWLWSDVASDIRGQLMVDGAVAGSTSYHSGGSKWELVSSSAISIAATAQRIGIRLSVRNGGGTTSYCGGIWVEGGPPVREYPFPAALMPHGPSAVLSAPVTVSESDLTAEYRSGRYKAEPFEMIRYRDPEASTEVAHLLFETAPEDGKRLWMPGSAPLTVPATDAAIVEVDYTDSLLLAKLAARKLIEREMPTLSGTDLDKMAQLAGRLTRDINELVGRTSGGAAKAVPLYPGW